MASTREGEIASRQTCCMRKSQLVELLELQIQPGIVLPDSDFEHAAEQLGVVGDYPADVDDQLLLEDSFPLPALGRALAVDDALDHSWRQRVGDHLLLMPKQTQGHLVIMCKQTKKSAENLPKFSAKKEEKEIMSYYADHFIRRQFQYVFCSFNLKLASSLWVKVREYVTPL